ncbi:DcrB-related protein [Salmonella enterica]|nr:DcrB-related protein [Salmonella enterica]EJH7441369.1 DcrB-related protein [Salmonella enterica]EJH7880792.1 DcrB-related protein [Salmonella enterica]EJI6713485.1 DcrB-related protein [Salmonella enterica]
MSQYILPEGCITLPDEDVLDVSITLLRFPSRGTSLTITRAPLPPGQDAGELYRQQLEQVSKKQRHFVIREQRETRAGINGDVPGTEILCQYDQHDATVCQYQFSGQCGQSMVVFCYSRMGNFIHDDMVHWQGILASLVPADN